MNASQILVYMERVRMETIRTLAPRNGGYKGTICEGQFHIVMLSFPKIPTAWDVVIKRHNKIYKPSQADNNLHLISDKHNILG